MTCPACEATIGRCREHGGGQPPWPELVTQPPPEADERLEPDAAAQRAHAQTAGGKVLPGHTPAARAYFLRAAARLERERAEQLREQTKRLARSDLGYADARVWVAEQLERLAAEQEGK